MYLKEIRIGFKNGAFSPHMCIIFFVSAEPWFAIFSLKTNIS
jgi:hypothetical protein